MKNKVIHTFLLIIFMVPAHATFSDEVNIYSARKEYLIKPLTDEFTKETGIKVNILSAKSKVLIKKIIDEGKSTPADILLTVDAGNLHDAKNKGISIPIRSNKLMELVPAHLRDIENHWFGLSIRSRVIMYNPNKISSSKISTYESLANSELKNRVCIRSSSNIYNQSLMSSIIHHNGELYAYDWASNVVRNFSRSPKGNDRSQMTSVVLGKCDVTLANTYYLGKWITSKKEIEREYAKKIKVIFPNQNDRGAHINISGALITKYSKNIDSATKLIEFLASDRAQEIYAKKNHEYPIRQDIEVSNIVKSWGYPFKMDMMSLTTLGSLNNQAGIIFDKAGWK